MRTEGTVNMETDKLIEALRTESCYKDKATLEIMDLCMMAADKLEELNNFEQSQSAKLLAQLTSKDKRLAALTAALIDCGYDDGSICDYCANDGACDIETNEYVQKKGSCFVFRGPQGTREGGG